MRKGIGTLAGLALAFGFFAPRAQAGETVFTDQGWYRVEGNAPTPLPDQEPNALQTAPAAAPAQAPAPTAQRGMTVPPPPEIPPAPPAEMRPPQPEAQRSCLDARGALARRILALHGLELGQAQVTDAQLGALGIGNLAAPLPFTASLTLDPDLNLLQGNLPVPPSSANWDEEVRQDWLALVACESD